MNKLKFRIIELPTHQMLLTKDFDTENEEANFQLVITVFVEDGSIDVKLNAKMNYKDEVVRDSAFDRITEKGAQEILDTILSNFKL